MLFELPYIRMTRGIQNMRGVSILSPARNRKSCPVCHSIAVRHNKKNYRCARCGAIFQAPIVVYIDPTVYKPYKPYKVQSKEVNIC